MAGEVRAGPAASGGARQRAGVRRVRDGCRGARLPAVPLPLRRSCGVAPYAFSRAAKACRSGEEMACRRGARGAGRAPAPRRVSARARYAVWGAWRIVEACRSPARTREPSGSGASPRAVEAGRFALLGARDVT